MDTDLEYCGCGMPIVNNKCSRHHPIKACKGEQTERKPKFSGRSKFWDDKQGYMEV